MRFDLQPGDVGIFSRSAPSHSSHWRRQMYLSDNADSVGGDQRAAHYARFHPWLKKKYAEDGKHNVYFE